MLPQTSRLLTAALLGAAAAPSASSHMQLFTYFSTAVHLLDSGACACCVFFSNSRASAPSISATDPACHSPVCCMSAKCYFSQTATLEMKSFLFCLLRLCNRLLFPERHSGVELLAVLACAAAGHGRRPVQCRQCDAEHRQPCIPRHRHRPALWLGRLPFSGALLHYQSVHKLPNRIQEDVCSSIRSLHSATWRRACTLAEPPLPLICAAVHIVTETLEHLAAHKRSCRHCPA